MRCIFIYIYMLISSVVYCAGIDSVRISCSVNNQGNYTGQTIDKAYKMNYAPLFKEIDFEALSESEEEGVFGCPITFVVDAGNKHYVLIMNNAHGIFSVYRANKSANGVYMVPDAYLDSSKTVFLPSLYEKLKGAGVNILGEKQLKSIFSLPKQEQQKYWKSYIKARETSP